jgi:hypothetical protein
MDNAATRPAAADETAEPVPSSGRVTPLARAALELGVEADDVLAYLVGNGSHRACVERFMRAL